MRFDYFHTTARRVKNGPPCFERAKHPRLTSAISGNPENPGLPIDCYDDSPSAVVKDLSIARDKSNDVENCLALSDLRRVIHFADIDSQLSIICSMSYIFLLQVPAGAIPMRRPTVPDDLATRKPIDSQSVSFLVEISGPFGIVLKLRMRKT